MTTLKLNKNNNVIIPLNDTKLYTQKEFNEAIKEAYENGYDDGYKNGYKDGINE